MSEHEHDRARITLLEAKLEQLSEISHFHQTTVVGSLWQICKDLRSLKEAKVLMLEHLNEVSKAVEQILLTIATQDELIVDIRKMKQDLHTLVCSVVTLEYNLHSHTSTEHSVENLRDEINFINKRIDEIGQTISTLIAVGIINTDAFNRIQERFDRLEEGHS